jgi:hypothetical protein
VKFLGLHIATNLNWEKQIESISKKCENPLKILNCIKNTWWWGADPVILLRLYRALIQSRMEYSAF